MDWNVPVLAPGDSNYRALLPLGKKSALKTDFIQERVIAKNRKEIFSWNHR